MHRDKTTTTTKKHGPNERTVQNSKKELSNKEIDKLSDGEFKALVIRMLTEMIEFSCKMKEEMKVTQSEIKENIQGTNSEGKETGNRGPNQRFRTKGRNKRPTGKE